MRRKLLCISAALAFGVWLCGTYGITAVGIIPAVFLSISYLLRDSGGVPDRKLVIACLLAFSLGSLVTSVNEWQYSKDASLAGTNTEITGKVIKIERREYYTGLTLSTVRTGEKGGRKLYGKVLIKTKDAVTDSLLRKEIRDEVMLALPDKAVNPGCFDYRKYLKSKRVFLTGEAGSIRSLDGYRGFTDYILNRLYVFRESFIRDLDMDEGEKALLKGIMFGDKSEIDEETMTSFRENGLSHMLAVSGLHIGLLYGIYRWLYRRWKKPGIRIVLVLFLLSYGTLSMWSVSVLRAVMLIFLIELCDILERRFDLITSLAFLSSVILIVSPFTLRDPSFIMSFLAVFSMGTISNALEYHMNKGAAKVLGIQAGMTPYMAYSFDLISPIAMLANIPELLLLSFALPLAMILMCLAGASSLLAGGIGILELAAQVITKGVGLVIFSMKLLSGVFELIPFSSFDVTSPRLWVMVLIYSVLFISSSELMMVSNARRKAGLLLLPVLFSMIITLLCVPLSYSAFDKADIVMIDVGQGDALHIKGSGGNDILIDGGGKEDYDIGRKVLKPYLLHNGASDLEAAFVTHLHMDHYKGIEELSGDLSLKNLIKKGKAGDRYRIGKDIGIKILWPEEEGKDSEDENENTLVFKVFIKGATLLVTGDIGEAAESGLLKLYEGTGELDCDILKVAHHGSKYSSSEAFLNEVSPKIALIGVGKNNTYGHPAREALERLENTGVKVFRTDQDGAIGVAVHNGRLICTTMNSGGRWEYKAKLQ